MQEKEKMMIRRMEKEKREMDEKNVKKKHFSLFWLLIKSGSGDINFFLFILFLWSRYHYSLDPNPTFFELVMMIFLIRNVESKNDIAEPLESFLACKPIELEELQGHCHIFCQVT